MKKSILALSFVSVLMVVLAIGCAEKSSNSSTKRNNSSFRGNCDPNYANCNNQAYYGNNNNGNWGNNRYGNGGCGMGMLMTEYGCLPTSNCPSGYGYHQQTNLCYPSAQNGNYNGQQYYGNSNGYYDPYYNGY